MGANDFLNGQMAANFANGAAIDDAVGAARSWKNYSKQLQSRLNKADVDLVKAESGRIGFAHLFKTVLEELRRVDPQNRLLQKEVQLQILGTKVAEKAAEMGYIYDPDTGTVIGKR